VLYRWTTNVGYQTITDHPNWTERPEQMTTASGGSAGIIDLILEASQNIRTIQNSGTNAQFKINVSVMELPA